MSLYSRIRDRVNRRLEYQNLGSIGHHPYRRAYEGYKLAKNFAKNSKTMAPVPRTPNSRSSSRYKRKTTMSGSTVRTSRTLPSLFKRRRTGVARVPQTTRDVLVKVKKRPKKLKRVKRVKVSPYFKKKVESALAHKAVLGDFRETHFGNLNTDAGATFVDYGIESTLPPPSNIDLQWLYGRTTNGNWNFEHFTFEQILDATLVLFFNRIQFLSSQNSEGRHRALSTENQGLLHSKWKVRDAHVTYFLRNNTQRTMYMECFRCSPKQKVASNDSYGFDVLNEWKYALQNTDSQALPPPLGIAFNPNLEKIGVIGQNEESGTPACTNKIGVTINELGLHPSQCPQMRARWTFGSTVIKLEPGQDHTFVIQGPKNFVMDPQTWKMNKNIVEATDEFNYAKHKPGISETMFFRVIPELLPANSVLYTAGRYGDIVSTVDARGVSVQANHVFKIEMPETTGTTASFENNGESGPDYIVRIANANRKPVYYYNTWVNGVVPDTYDRIDELVPDNPEPVT